MRSIFYGVLAGTISCAGTASGDTGALVVKGKAADHDQLVAERTVADRLRAAGWALPDKPLSKSEANSIIACFQAAKAPEVQACVLRVVHDRGIHRVAFLSIDPDPASGSTSLKITVRVVSAGVESVLTDSHFCDHCTDDTLASSALAVTGALLDRIAVETGHTVLSVKSTPQAARFTVDGSFVGATDASIDIKPGIHTVIIEHDGYASETRTIEATEGKTSEITVTMRSTDQKRQPGPTDSSSGTPAATSPAHQGDRAPRRSLALPVALVVVGGVAIAGGVVALALDESPQAALPGQVQPQHYRDTTMPGVAALAGGVVVAAVGGALWWEYTHAETAPSVVPVTGGAVVGLTGTF